MTTTEMKNPINLRQSGLSTTILGANSRFVDGVNYTPLHIKKSTYLAISRDFCVTALRPLLYKPRETGQNCRPGAEIRILADSVSKTDYVTDTQNANLSDKSLIYLHLAKNAENSAGFVLFKKR